LREELRNNETLPQIFLEPHLLEPSSSIFEGAPSEDDLSDGQNQHRLTELAKVRQDLAPRMSELYRLAAISKEMHAVVLSDLDCMLQQLRQHAEDRYQAEAGQVLKGRQSHKRAGAKPYDGKHHKK
jgi:hypothetical protein